MRKELEADLGLGWNDSWEYLCEWAGQRSRWIVTTEIHPLFLIIWHTDGFLWVRRAFERILMAAEKHDQLLLSQTINSYNLMDYRPHFHSRTMKGAQPWVQCNLPCLYAKLVLTQQQAIRCSTVPEPPGLQGHTIIYSRGLWSWTVSDINACLWVITGCVPSV